MGTIRQQPHEYVNLTTKRQQYLTIHLQKKDSLRRPFLLSPQTIIKLTACMRLFQIGNISLFLYYF
jgi:hypothetical protein